MKIRMPNCTIENVLPEMFRSVIYRQLLACVLCLGPIAGCGGIPKAGLHPENPPAEMGTFALWTDYVEVESLQPELRWQTFPRPEDIEADKAGELNLIQELSYELRVWKTITGSSGELVYKRRGLTQAHHTLEEPLEPSTKYLWSVRAQFMLDGYTRVTEWGLAGFLLQGEVVPNPSCYRFKTAKNQE
jgi:hypothetical protein